MTTKQALFIVDVLNHFLNDSSIVMAERKKIIDAYGEKKLKMSYLESLREAQSEWLLSYMEKIY